MARQNVDQWVPEEQGSDVLNVIDTNSAIERIARREPMGSQTKRVMRAGGVDVAVTPKGAAYTESDSQDGSVLLEAVKFTGLIRIAEEDLDDAPANIVALRQKAWGNTYAKKVDHACLGVTAAGNLSTATPFDSVYYTLSVADASVGYVAGSNIIQSAGAVTRTHISEALGKLETGDHYGNIVVIAHPSFLGTLRTLKNEDGTAAYLAGNNETPDTIFGHAIAYSQGAKTDSVNSAAPTGNPLLVIANREFLIFGVRSGPESAVVQGFNSVGVTDEALIKMRARRAFKLGDPRAAVVLEVTPGV